MFMLRARARLLVQCGRRSLASSAHGRRKGDATDLGPPVVELRDVTKQFGGGVQGNLFSNLNLTFLHGAKIGVIGANGAGKSSLLKILAGLDTDIFGEVWRAPDKMIRYLHQEPQLDPAFNVRENIMRGAMGEQVQLLERFNDVSMQMGEPDADFDALLEEQSELQSKIDELDCWDIGYLCDTAMRALHVPPGDADVTSLSGGERRRVALCRLLLEKPDFLLLDEPTNHLDATSVAWLESHLQQFNGTVLLITHDRYFLDNVVDWILEVDNGSIYPFKGSYSQWLEERQGRLDTEKARERARGKQMQRELQWLRQGAHTKNKARERKYEELVANASKNSGRVDVGNIVIPPGPRLGNKAVSVRRATATVDGRVLFKDLTFDVNPGDILGIVGSNGTGKSTLMQFIAGERELDGGEVELGQTVSMGIVTQGRDTLDDDNVVYAEIAQGREEIDMMDGRSLNIRQYVAAFNFRGSQQSTRVGELSGGQRNRVHLAKELSSQRNVLLLDEPTNDLDVQTLSNLEQAIDHFVGSMIIVSHDRFFLNRVCTHTLELGAAGDNSGRWTLVRGNYDALVAHKVMCRKTSTRDDYTEQERLSSR